MNKKGKRKQVTEALIPGLVTHDTRKYFGFAYHQYMMRGYVNTRAIKLEKGI